MKSISGKAFANLERPGWQFMRANGSHHIYGESGSGTRLSVPIHGNESLKIG